VRTIMFAGASSGAKASLIAAPVITPPVSAVVSLSPQWARWGQDVQPFAAMLRAPVLFFVANGELFGAPDATPQLYKTATRASSRRPVVLPGDAHGIDLLTGRTAVRSGP